MPVAAHPLNSFFSLTREAWVPGPPRAYAGRRRPDRPPVVQRPGQTVRSLTSASRGRSSAIEDRGGHRLGVDPALRVVLLALLLVHLGLHGAGGAARVDAGDAYAVAVLLVAQRVGERLEAVLARGVRAPPGVGVEPGSGVHEEDVAPGDAELREQEAGELGGGDQVGVDLEVPCLGGQLPDLAQLDDARDVQQAVDPLGHRLLAERPGQPVGVAEVADEGAYARVALGELLGAAGVAGEQDEVVAALQEAAGDGGPDAGTGAGDEVGRHGAILGHVRRAGAGPSRGLLRVEGAGVRPPTADRRTPPGRRGRRRRPWRRRPGRSGAAAGSPRPPCAGTAGADRRRSPPC
ncbi:hypothetical protein SCALM49S_05124 [Streptomyces californicus]